ncbi:MAG: hypothetical protein QNJ44_22195 [Rhodobacter sp.]|nr:hypothetical protein [Rhodobacter sp.]
MRIPLLLAAAVFVLSPVLAKAQYPPPFGGSQNTYLCHNINQAQALNYIAVVEDQFGDTEFDILEATKICNPVLQGKFAPPGRDSEEIPGATDPELHYICYRIAVRQTNALGIDFQVENQLERQRYRSDQPVEICVPTLKARS